MTYELQRQKERSKLLFVGIAISFLAIGFNEMLYLNNIEKSVTGIFMLIHAIVYGWILGEY